jgi:hypothetical protein
LPDKLPSMSEAFRSPAAFRNDLCSSIAELTQRYTAPLPDRATVYVSGAEALYRLFKGLGTTFDALTGQVVIPSNGSPDRWLQEEVFGSSPWSGMEVSVATVTVTPGGASQWQAIGATPSTFALASGDANIFQLNTTSGLLTYHGPSRYMMLTANASLHSVAGDIFGAVISVNNDVAAGSSAAHPTLGAQATGNGDGQSTFVSTQRRVFLADTNTLRVMLRNSSGSAIEVDNFSLSALPA